MRIRLVISRLCTLACLLGLTLAARPVIACDTFAVQKKLFFRGSGFPDNSIVSLALGPQERLYVGTRDNGVVLLDGKQILARTAPTQRTDVADSLPNERIKGVAFDSESGLWVGSVGGLELLDPTTLSLRRAIKANATTFDDNIIQAVSQDQGFVTLGTTRGVSMSLRNWEFLTDADGLPSNIVNAVAIGPNKMLVAGTSDGIGIYHGSGFQRAGLEGEWTTSLCLKTPSKNLMNDTFRGLVRTTLEELRDLLRKHLDTRQPPPKAAEFDPVFAEVARFLDLLDPEKDKEEFYVGTNEGTYLFDAKQKNHSRVMEGWTTSLGVDSAGNLFVGQKGLELKPLVTIPNLIDTFEIGEMIREEGRRVIMGTASETEGIREIKADTTPASATVGSMTVGGNVTPDATSQGREIDTAKVEAYERFVNKLDNAEITSIAIDRRGTIWVGTSEAGLFRFLPICVNAEQPIHILEAMNVEKQHDDPEMYTKNGFQYYLVKAKQPKIDPEIMPLILEATAKWAAPGTYDYWIGRWSDLDKADRSMFLEFLARYGDAYHLAKYIPLFFYDSYVVLPIGPGKAAAGEGEAKTSQP